MSSVASKTSSGTPMWFFDGRSAPSYDLGASLDYSGLAILGATSGTAASHTPWSSSAVKLVLNLAGNEVVPLSWLAELVDRVVQIRDRVGDITSLGVPSARIMRDALGGLVIEVSTAESQTDDQVALKTLDGVAREISTARDLANAGDHTRLARDLREITGLPAGTLASAFGVSREQYQRWIAGKAISTIRHGQLTYLHSIAREIARKLGGLQAQVWWRTPGADGQAPEALLIERNLSGLYSWAVSIDDPQPVEGNVLPGLRKVDDDWDEDPPDGIEEQNDWSPYPESGTNHG